MMGDDAIVAGIKGLLRESRPAAEAVSIDGLERIVGGNSSEIWAFNATWREQGSEHQRALILRRAAANEFGSAGRAAEFRLLRALANTPARAPAALWIDGEGRHLGRAAMIMARAEGRADRALLREDNALGLDLAARLRFAGEIADLLAAIHRIDTAGLNLAEGMRAQADPARQQLAFYDAEIRRQEVEPMPELRLAGLWLREHLPRPPARRTLVHGDFRPANLLVADGAITTLLDWEFSHEGDPAEDLGWYLADYYCAEHFIPGFWERGDFLARYEAALGEQVDPAAIRFWAVFALFKLASMTVAALRAFEDGDASRMTPSARFILDPLLDAIGAAEVAA